MRRCTGSVRNVVQFSCSDTKSHQSNESKLSIFRPILTTKTPLKDPFKMNFFVTNGLGSDFSIFKHTGVVLVINEFHRLWHFRNVKLRKEFVDRAQNMNIETWTTFRTLPVVDFESFYIHYSVFQGDWKAKK